MVTPTRPDGTDGSEATAAVPLPARLLALASGLGIVSFVSSPWIVFIDWSAVRALYVWELLAFVQSSGEARSVAVTMSAIIAVGVSAAGVGAIAVGRSLRTRSLLLRGLLICAVGVLSAAYLTLLLVGDLQILLIVAVDGDDLSFLRRMAWLSGPVLRAVAVVGSLSCAGWAFVRTLTPPAHDSA